MWPGGACWERAHSMVPTPGASSWAVCTRTPGDESQPQQQQQLAVRRGRQHPFIRGEGLVTDGASTCEDRWWSQVVCVISECLRDLASMCIWVGSGCKRRQHTDSMPNSMIPVHSSQKWCGASAVLSSSTSWEESALGLGRRAGRGVCISGGTPKCAGHLCV